MYEFTVIYRIAACLEFLPLSSIEISHWKPLDFRRMCGILEKHMFRSKNAFSPTLDAEHAWGEYRRVAALTERQQHK